MLAKDDTNISMKKRSLHDSFLKKINPYNAMFYKSSKKVKINNNNCPIRMETSDDDKRGHSISLVISDKLI